MSDQLIVAQLKSPTTIKPVKKPFEQSWLAKSIDLFILKLNSLEGQKICLCNPLIILLFRFLFRTKYVRLICRRKIRYLFLLRPNLIDIKTDLSTSSFSFVSIIKIKASLKSNRSLSEQRFSYSNYIEFIFKKNFLLFRDVEIKKVHLKENSRKKKKFYGSEFVGIGRLVFFC